MKLIRRAVHDGRSVFLDREEYMSNKYDRHYPAIPLRNVTVFPGMVMHFDVSRKKSVKAVEASMAADELIYLVTQRDSQVSEPGIADLYTVGTIAK